MLSNMRSDSESAAANVYYLTLPVDGPDQSVSLANYLNAHGMEAVPEGNDGVTCPITKAELAVDLHELRKSWVRFWEHSDAEVFGLSVYVKPAEHDAGCPHTED